MEKETKPLSRKKFLSWGIGITSLLAVPAFFRKEKKQKEPRMVKMLTQDGQLVMIDADAIPSTKKKIEPKDIHNWITKKKSTF